MAKDLPIVHRNIIVGQDTVIIPGVKKMPKPPLPKRPRESHHKLKNRVMWAAVGVIVAIVLSSVTPLGAGAAHALQSSYRASANAFAYTQNQPAPYPTPPASGSVPPAPAAPSTGAPANNLTPHVHGVAAFLCAALPWARYASQQTRNGAGQYWRVSVILAQWGVEQGWSMPTYTGYNLGNVSAIAGAPSIGGIPVVGSPGAFAFAHTLADGVRYYVIFTGYGYYRGVNAAFAGGADAQARAIGLSPWDAAHYNPGNGPGGKLLEVMRANNLYRFDNPAVGC